jgi:hypothetical protein
MRVERPHRFRDDRRMRIDQDLSARRGLVGLPLEAAKVQFPTAAAGNASI